MIASAPQFSQPSARTPSPFANDLPPALAIRSLKDVGSGLSSYSAIDPSEQSSMVPPRRIQARKVHGLT